MKNISNFLVGSISSFGVANALPGTIEPILDGSGMMVDSFEALISLLSGILSAFLVDLFKRKVVDKRRK